jgi:glutamate-1-semialdehyde 2,1-aminomutase
MKKNTGQRLWDDAKKIIPGGNSLLSKRPEMFLPEKWPAYFIEAKGCSVVDLDNNKLTDMSLMGVGTNILGYGHEKVDDAVRKVIDSGNMSTLNCPDEVYLAEKLIDMHSWSGMARFARTGGEANAIAIRIARASSGKDKVAICGYHGWHDWYLSANLSSQKSLNDHLLPGLNPSGVPSGLKDTVFTFKYNDFEELERIVSEHDIGVIKMEVSRSSAPDNDFLYKVRKLSSKKSIILIFDECTSGFRQSYGGLHKFFNVQPDMAIFGKALGNGYPITAIIGKKEVMESAQSTFISSTFWTERIGYVAALSTLKEMESIKSWKIISNIGKQIVNKWHEIANKFELELNVSGLDALPRFEIRTKNFNAYKTLISQEMLKKGFLATNSIYVCIEHKQSIIEEYFFHLERVFKLIKECEDGRDIFSLLEGPESHSGFKRLN